MNKRAEWVADWYVIGLSWVAVVVIIITSFILLGLRGCESPITRTIDDEAVLGSELALSLQTLMHSPSCYESDGALVSIASLPVLYQIENDSFIKDDIRDAFFVSITRIMDINYEKGMWNVFAMVVDDAKIKDQKIQALIGEPLVGTKLGYDDYEGLVKLLAGISNFRADWWKKYPDQVLYAGTAFNENVCMYTKMHAVSALIPIPVSCPCPNGHSIVMVFSVCDKAFKNELAGVKPKCGNEMCV